MYLSFFKRVQKNFTRLFVSLQPQLRQQHSFEKRHRDEESDFLGTARLHDP